jgi:hypothetical protein
VNDGPREAGWTQKPHACAMAAGRSSQRAPAIPTHRSPVPAFEPVGVVAVMLAGASSCQCPSAGPRR